jgi:hypothetical protein
MLMLFGFSRTETFSAKKFNRQTEKQLVDGLLPGFISSHESEIRLGSFLL